MKMRLSIGKVSMKSQSPNKPKDLTSFENFSLSPHDRDISSVIYKSHITDKLQPIKMTTATPKQTNNAKLLQ